MGNRYKGATPKERKTRTINMEKMFRTSPVKAGVPDSPRVPQPTPNSIGLVRNTIQWLWNRWFPFKRGPLHILASGTGGQAVVLLWLTSNSQSFTECLLLVTSRARHREARDDRVWSCPLEPHGLQGGGPHQQSHHCTQNAKRVFTAPWWGEHQKRPSGIGEILAFKAYVTFAAQVPIA